jgi:hypothetical protein
MEPTTVTSKGHDPQRNSPAPRHPQGDQGGLLPGRGRVEMRLMTPPTASAISGFGMLKPPRPSIPADFDPVSLLRDEESRP